MKKYKRISDEELILYEVLHKSFGALQNGTFNERSQILYEILTIIEPNFITLDDLQALKLRCFKIVSIYNKDTFASRVKNFKSKNKQETENLLEYINNLLSNDYINFTTREDLRIYSKCTTEDVIKNNNLVLNAKQVYCTDTTYREKVFITFLQDLASRIIVHYLYTDHFPTGDELVDWLSKFFIEDNYRGSSITLVSDSSGAYISKELRFFLSEKGILHSIPKKGLSNQVSESYNRIFWDTVSKYAIKGFGEEDFLDYSDEMKVKIIEFCINTMNSRPAVHFTKKVDVSRIQLHDSLLISRYVNIFFKGKTKTNDAEIILKCYQNCLLRLKILKKQEVLENHGIYAEVENLKFETQQIDKNLMAITVNQDYRNLADKMNFVDNLLHAVQNGDNIKTYAEKLLETLEKENFTNITTI